jgi:hypothetical protein
MATLQHEGLPAHRVRVRVSLTDTSNQCWRASFVAVQFTEFHPDYASAVFARSIGEAGDPRASLVTGIAGWVSDVVPALLGRAMNAVGAVGAAALRKT